MTTYFKAVRPNGTDFHTGTIDYLAGGVIEHPTERKGAEDPRTYLSVSTAPTDCTGFSWPARLLEVEAVGDVWTPHAGYLPNKRAVKALRVVRELDAKLLLGPQAEQFLALVERARTLTHDEAKRVTAARDAAWDAARAAAWVAARDAARDAVGDAAWGAAWGAARGAAGDALKPTVDVLQTSAIALLDTLIDPKAAV